MSEENASKLRLKPKLVAEPEVAVRQPVVQPVVPENAPPVVVDESKTVRLKPKLSVAPSQTNEVAAPREPAVVPAAFPPAPNDFPPAVVGNLPSETEKATSRFSLKPKAPVEGATPVFPPPPPEVAEPIAPASVEPIPAPVLLDPEEMGRTTPAMGSRALTARPFPPPPANFPPPPSGGTRPAPPWAHSGVRVSEPKKNIGLIAGGIVVVLLVLGGIFFAYQKFTASPLTEPPAKPKVVAAPQVVAPAGQAAVEEVKPKIAAPVQEVTPKPAAVVAKVPEVVAVETPPAPAPVPVEVPPPPASAAFKAWVDNLRVGGIRPGANPRVMIGSNSYLIGNVVNPQLGIIFDGYNAETHKLTFKDKTGAKLERRN